MKPCHNKFCTLDATHIEHNVALPRYFCSKGCQLASHIQALTIPPTHAIVLIQAGTKRLPTDDKESEDEKKRPKSEVVPNVPLPEPEVEVDPITLTPISELEPSAVVYVKAGNNHWDIDSLWRQVGKKHPFNTEYPFKPGVPSSVEAKNPLTGQEFPPEDAMRILATAKTRRAVIEQQIFEYAGARNMDAFVEKYRLLVDVYNYQVSTSWARLFLQFDRAYVELVCLDIDIQTPEDVAFVRDMANKNVVFPQMESQLIEYAAAGNRPAFVKQYRRLVEVFEYQTYAPWVMRVFDAGGDPYYEIVAPRMRARHRYRLEKYGDVYPGSDMPEDITFAFAVALREIKYPMVKTRFGTYPASTWCKARASWSVNGDEEGETTYTENPHPRDREIDIGVSEIRPVIFDKEVQTIVLTIEFELTPPRVTIDFPAGSSITDTRSVLPDWTDKSTIPRVTAYDFLHYNNRRDAISLEEHWELEREVLLENRFGYTHHIEIEYWLPDSDDPKTRQVAGVATNPYPVIFEIVHDFLHYGNPEQYDDGSDDAEIRIEIVVVPNKQK